MNASTVIRRKKRTNLTGERIAVFLSFLRGIPFAEILLHVADVAPGLFAQTREGLVPRGDAGGEMNAHFGILRLENQASVSQNVLDDAMLLFVDILEHPEIGGLVVIHGEQFLLDAVNAFVRHDDDVEKVMVETNEKLGVRQEEECRENDEDGVARERLDEHAAGEHDDARSHDEDVPDDEPEDGPEEPDPVLMVVELVGLSLVFGLKAEAERGGRFCHSQRRRCPTMMKTIIRSVWAR